MQGSCHYYGASPLVPPRPEDPDSADALRNLRLPPEMLDIGVPTHVLWGDSDPALQPALVEGLEPWVPRLTVQHLAGTSHWVVHEQPDAVRQALEQFLSRPVQ